MTPESKNGTNHQSPQAESSNSAQLLQQLRELKIVNERLQIELAEMKKDRDCLHKTVLDLLPDEPIDIDEAEVADILAHPEKYQTMDEVLKELEAEFTNNVG